MSDPKRPLRIIGTSTLGEFNKWLRIDSAFMRRCVEVVKEPYSKEEILKILPSKWEALTRISANQSSEKADEAFRRIFDISDNFCAKGSPLSKAIDLLEKIVANRKYNGASLTSELTKEEIQKSAQELYNLAPSFFDVGKQSQRYAQFVKTIDEKIGENNPNIKETLKNIAIRSLTGVTDINVPKGRILLAGPSGVGKTYTAKIYAQAMGLPAEVIKMTKYAGKMPEALYEDIGNALQKNPYTVLIFDEIEKTPVYIQNAILEILDSHSISIPTKLPNGLYGESIPLKISNSTIFFTTNAGQRNIKNMTASFSIDRLKRAMAKHNLSEFLLDRVTVLPTKPPATEAEFAKTVRNMLINKKEAVAKQMDNIAINIQDEEKFIQELIHKYWKENTSYRPVYDSMNEAIESSITSELLKKINSSNSIVNERVMTISPVVKKN